MKSPLTRVAVALLALAGCSNNAGAPPPPPAAGTTAAVAPAAGPAAAPAAAPTATATADAAPAAASGPATADKADESKLERAAPLPAAGKLPPGKWVAGTNYRVLVPAQPTDSAPGKVEVVEVFWYACPHCYALDPYLESWRKSRPAYIDFRRVPVTWQDVHRSHARLFYALEALGKEEALHNDVFAEMHDRKNIMYTQGNDAATLAAQLAFVKAHGISEADFNNAYNSFTVQTDLTKADDLVHRYKVDGVPLIVINGKYVTDVGMAGGETSLISLITDLASSEKTR
jgi:protein dithiol oxidoreductase (disulfide-forming)